MVRGKVDGAGESCMKGGGEESGCVGGVRLVVAAVGGRMSWPALRSGWGEGGWLGGLGVG